MPRQNRVTPSGQIVAVPERGTMMGNRGVLHDAEGRIRRPWQVRRWLICVLEFRSRHRTVMAPNRYTELFFLDEATALAAGHRPCFECRRRAFYAFRDAWAAANPALVAGRIPTAGLIDDALHAQRIGADRSKRTHRADLDGLPDGVLVTLDGSGDVAYLVRGRHLLAWTPGGYAHRRRRPSRTVATVLTPSSTVAAIRARIRPGGPPLGLERADAALPPERTGIGLRGGGGLLRRLNRGCCPMSTPRAPGRGDRV